MADQVKYPHQAYMQKHHVRMADLPADIKEMVVVWNNDWQDHTPKTSAHPSLVRASKLIQEEIEDFLDIDDEEDGAKPATYKGKDGILHKLYQAGKTQVSLQELKDVGYKPDFLGGLPMTQAHYKLKALKGQKNTYQICVR